MESITMPIAEKDGRAYIGFCPLYNECYEFAVDDENHVICFVHNNPNTKTAGNTCEHMIVTLVEDLPKLKSLIEKERCGPYYGQFFPEGIGETG